MHLLELVFCFLDIYAGMALLGHTAVLFFAFWDASIVFFIVGTSVYIPTNTLRGFPFLHTSSVFVFCELLNDSHYDWSEVGLDCIFYLPFSNKYKCWASFNVPVDLLHVFFGGRFISVFSLFLHWVFCNLFVVVAIQ